MEKTETIAFEIFEFLQKITDSLGEPVTPDINEIKKLEEEIINSPVLNNPQIAVKFFMIIRVRGDVIFTHNTSQYLDVPENYTLLDFFNCVGDKSGNASFIFDYLTWAKAAYLFADEILPANRDGKLSYRIRIPMRLKDGCYYWIQQDSRPFEFDKNGRMVSHLNSYTVICRYNETAPHGLLAEIYYNELYCDELSRKIAQTRFEIQPFLLKAIQREMLFYFHEYPDATISMCAASLRYPANTIKKYISNCQTNEGIIDKARLAFPGKTFRSLKEVLAYLEIIHWFDIA